MHDLSGRRILPAAFLACALLLGGGGHAPLRAMAIELGAIVVIAVALLQSGPPLRPARLGLALIAAIIALPLLQMVPLPARWWQALPWRQTLLPILTASGTASAMHPLSFDPDATLETMLTLLAPVAMFVATLRAEPGERRILLGVVVAAACVSLLLGMAQQQAYAPFLFSRAQREYAVGLFVNHNQQGDMLLIGMLCLAALAVGIKRGPVPVALAAAGIVVLAVGVVLTQSRMAMVMLPIVAIVSGALMVGVGGRRLRGVAALLLVAAPVVLVVGQTHVAQTSLARFGSAEEQRPVFWRTTARAIAATWPAGTGVGTFVPVYKVFETPDEIGFSYVNHAHNDYLELVLEGGAPAALLLVVYLALFATRVAKLPDEPESLVAAAGIAVLLVHALVDYPLRMPALSATFGMFNAILFLPAISGKNRRRRSKIGQPEQLGGTVTAS